MGRVPVMAHADVGNRRRRMGTGRESWDEGENQGGESDEGAEAGNGMLRGSEDGAKA